MGTDGVPPAPAPLAQGDVRLLQTDQASRLLASTVPARFALTWTDGTPRVLPTWFHWTGEELVTVTYTAGPEIGIRHSARRVAVLRKNPDVAITIDTNDFPPVALLIRGRATVTEIAGIAPEYASAAKRYLGDDAGASFIESVDKPGTRQARIAVRPTWVGLLDFATRLPSPQGGIRG